MVLMKEGGLWEGYKLKKIIALLRVVCFDACYKIVNCFHDRYLDYPMRYLNNFVLLIVIGS